MKIRVSRAVALSTLAIFCLFLVLIFAITLVRHFSVPVLSIAIILFVAGVGLKRKNIFIIFRSHGLTGERFKKTLDLLKLSYRQVDDTLELDRTGTKLRVITVGPVSVIVFTFASINSPQEKYITATLVKYQS